MRVLSISDQIQDTFNQFACDLISQKEARKKIEKLQKLLQSKIKGKDHDYKDKEGIVSTNS